MKRAPLILLLVAASLFACQSAPDFTRTLPPGAPALIPLGPHEPVPDFSGEWEARYEILEALQNSIAWTKRRHAERFFPAAGITYERALASLQRFDEVLRSSQGPADLQARIERDFTIYKSAGWNGRGGGVLFTAYCTPILRGSLQRDGKYKYPLYGLPPDLVKDKDGNVLGWQTAFKMMEQYPTRGAIEAGALLANKGLELVWLADPIDAYIAHVNGSAFIELPGGEMYRLGYAGKNGRQYRSLGKALEADGVLPPGGASLASIRRWAAETPIEEVQAYLHQNESYVFFTPIESNPHGSLDVPVTGGRSLATDKTLFPRGAVVFVDTNVPDDADSGPAPFQHFLFDQDTGGAIRTAGRADIYLGVGPKAEARAGRTKSEGQLYYLFVKE